MAKILTKSGFYGILWPGGSHGPFNRCRGRHRVLLPNRGRDLRPLEARPGLSIGSVLRQSGEVCLPEQAQGLLGGHPGSQAQAGTTTEVSTADSGIRAVSTDAYAHSS